MKYENHGVEVRFECKGGLVPRDKSSMRCNNGTWSSSAECVPGTFKKNHFSNHFASCFGLKCIKLLYLTA